MNDCARVSLSRRLLSCQANAQSQGKSGGPFPPPEVAQFSLAGFGAIFSPINPRPQSPGVILPFKLGISQRKKDGRE